MADFKQKAPAQGGFNDDPEDEIAQVEQPPKGPRYELTAQAYIDDVLHEIGARITYIGKPGWHMKPINNEARALVAKHYPNGQAFIDPVEQMAQITSPASVAAAA